MSNTSIVKRDPNNKYWNEALETMPREELEKFQLEHLQEIVQVAYDHPAARPVFRP